MRLKKWLSALVEPARHVFSHIPVIGPLVYCKWVDHKAAIKEMTTIMLFATAAFWLTSFILMGTQAARALGYMSVLFTTVNRGELFIFTVGFIGPILLHTSEDKKDEKAFPGRHWVLLVLIILALVASAYHSQIKSAQLTGTIIPADMSFLFNVSLGLATFVVVLRYLAMVYRKSTFSPQIEIKIPEESFSDAYAEHRRNKLNSNESPGVPN